MIPLLILTALLIVVPAHGQTRAEISSPSSRPSVITEPKSGARYRQIPAGSFLMGSGGESRPSSWSADGRFIAFAGKRDGVWNIWSVRTDTGALTRLTDNNSVTVFMRDPVWFPDGKQILYESGTTSSQIWLSNPAAVQ